MARNSRRYTIKEKSPCNKSNLYTVINLEAMQKAMKNIIPKNTAAFELWCVLMMNQEGFSEDFSTAKVRERYGISVDRSQKAWNVLVELGYLVETGKNSYEFYDTPREIKQENPVQSIEDKTGFSCFNEQDFPVQNILIKQENPARNITNNNTIDITMIDNIPSCRKRNQEEETIEILDTSGEWRVYKIKNKSL